MPLVIEANKANRMSWLIDASYRDYTDMKVHSGRMMLLGKGSKQRKSIKQKINTRSSIEAEIVRVDDHVSSIMRRMLLMENQGYKVEYKVINQDNQSAMIMGKWEILICVEIYQVTC